MEAAFEQAALALTALTVDPASLVPCDAVEIRCQEPDEELLLFAWLNAVILEMDTRHMAFGRFEVHLDAGRLNATAWGERLDPRRHELRVEAKAATCSQLQVGQRPDGLWVAQCIVDV